ncbi:MAG: phosphoribosylanthranilate isomerase [Deltaproteobacteria bacterium]
MRVKICGIKRIEDALKAIEFGADAIGLLIKTQSKNSIDENTAREIVRTLPPFCSSVMVVITTDIKEIVELSRYIGVTAIQLHGENSPEDILNIKRELPFVKIIKTLHVTNIETINNCKKYFKIADAILLDSTNFSGGAVGGTGLTHDWSISRKIVEESPIPVILAGGLNPENVAEAVKIVEPYGVDVQSGVNGEDGFKDYAKLERFIKKAAVG